MERITLLVARDAFRSSSSSTLFLRRCPNSITASTRRVDGDNGGRVVLLVPAEFTVLTPSWVELLAEEGEST